MAYLHVMILNFDPTCNQQFYFVSFAPLKCLEMYPNKLGASCNLLTAYCFVFEIAAQLLSQTTTGAIGAAFTFVVLRKMGKSVHYYLSVWYYAVIGFVECIIAVSVLGEWKIPYCGRDRWLLMLIAVLGIAGQTFLTKALQIEKAGPVALMRTLDVVLAFIFQFIFFNRAPTMWSLGGALCVVVSTSGVALQKWYSNSRKS